MGRIIQCTHTTKAAALRARSCPLRETALKSFEDGNSPGVSLAAGVQRARRSAQARMDAAGVDGTIGPLSCGSNVIQSAQRHDCGA